MNKKVLSTANLLRFAVVLSALVLSACTGSTPAAQTAGGQGVDSPAGVIADAQLQIGEIAFTGSVQAITESTVQVDGMTFRVDDQTSWAQDLRIGSLVQVRALTLPDQTQYALSVQFADDLADTVGEVEFKFKGEVVSISDSSWQIGEQTVLVDAETRIEAEIVAGDLVEVQGVVVDGQLLAREISLEELHKNTATPMPAEQALLEVIGQLAAIDGTALQVGSLTFAITAATEIEDGLQVGDIVKVEAARAENGTFTALEIELAERDDLSDPAVVSIKITGLVESIGETLWVIGDFQVVVGAGTEISDDLAVGDLAEVEGLLQADGSLLAREIDRVDMDNVELDDADDDDLEGDEDEDDDLGDDDDSDLDDDEEDDDLDDEGDDGHNDTGDDDESDDEEEENEEEGAVQP